jgi:hypothetical protein
MVMYVSSDCLEVINLMKTKSLCRYIAILLGNDKHTRYFKVVNIQHEGGEFNVDAHLLGGMRSHNLLVVVCARLAGQIGPTRSDQWACKARISTSPQRYRWALAAINVKKHA